MKSNRSSIALSFTFGILLLAIPAAASDVPEDFSRVVVLGKEDVTLSKDSTVISGDVVTNESGGTMKLEEGVTTPAGFAVKSDDLLIVSGATVNGDAFCNSGSSSCSALTLDVFSFLPPFRTGPTSGTDVTVSNGGSSTLAAGDYGVILIGEGGTLTLSGGVYNVKSVECKKNGAILFDAAGEVRADENLTLEENCRAGSDSGVSASRAAFFVNGVGGANLGVGSTVDANIYAPNGTLTIENDSVCTGAFIGKIVDVKEGVEFNLNSFFNEAPEPQDDSATLLEGAMVTGNVLTNDSDPNPDDTLTATAQTNVPLTTGVLDFLNADGSFKYTHDGSENFNDGFTYEVCDDGNPVHCTDADVSITITPVNDQPTLDDPAGDATINEDAAEQTVNLTGIAQGGDAPGFNNETLPAQFPLVVTATSDNTGLIPDPTVTYSSPDAAGSLSYTPVADQHGVATITVTVTDQGGTANGGVDSISQDFTVTVNSVNDAPSFTKGPDVAVAEDAGAQNIAWATNISAGPPDESGQTLTFSASNDNNGLFVSQPAVDSAGNLTFQAGPNLFGVANVSVQLMDDGGTANGGVDVSPVENFTITVNAVNDPPVINDQSLETDSETELIIDLTGSDPVEGDNLSYTITSAFSNPAIGSLIDFQQGGNAASIKFLPSGDGSTGSGTFDYEVCDDGTPVNECDTATVTITVAIFHAPPTADDQSIFANGTNPLPITLTGSDPEGTVLDFTLVSGPNAGAVTGLPASNLSSVAVSYQANVVDDPDAFVFRVCDQGSPIKCDTATVTINSTEPVNTPPTANEQSVETAGAASIQITLTGSDAEDTVLDFALISGAGLPPDFGTVTGLPQNDVASAVVTYTPTDDQANAEDSFLFQVCDQESPPLCDTATVFINPVAEGTNDPPNAQADTIQVAPGGTETTLIDGSTSLLGNDSDPNSGDTLSVTTTPVSGPSEGTVTLQSDGQFSYTNTNAAATSDQFEYEACDDGTPVECDTATVFVQIIPASVQVTVTKVTLGSSSGTVLSSPSGIDCGSTCSASFGTSQPISLIAQPGANSIVVGFSGDADCVDGSLTPDGNKSCTVTFDDKPVPQGDPVTVTVTKNGTGTGTVTSAPAGIDCGADCSEIFSFQTRVSLLAQADSDSSFEGFSGDADCADAELEGEFNTNCTATFDLLPANRFALAVVLAGTGAGSVTSSPAGISCGSECAAEFESGTAVTLFARAEFGSVFSSWSGDCTGTGFSTSVTVDAAKSCTAIFNASGQ